MDFYLETFHNIMWTTPLNAIARYDGYAKLTMCRIVSHTSTPTTKSTAHHLDYYDGCLSIILNIQQTLRTFTWLNGLYMHVHVFVYVWASIICFRTSHVTAHTPLIAETKAFNSTLLKKVSVVYFAYSMRGSKHRHTHTQQSWIKIIFITIKEHK